MSFFYEYRILDEKRQRAILNHSIQWIVTISVFVAAYYVYRIFFVGDEFINYTWDFNILRPYLPALGRGLVLTLELTAICLVLSMILGVFVAMARQSRIVPLRLITAGYIEVMRSTPLLIQLVWIFYALPILSGITLPSYEAAILALTVHMAAYYGEAFRAGTQSIPKEYFETADVLGLSAFDRARYIVLPLATRNVLPVLVTLTLLLIKDTSLVSVLGINDLMNVGTTVATSTFKPLEVLTTVGLVYLLVALPLTILVRKLEVSMANKIV